MNIVSDAVGVRSLASVVLLDEEQQRILHEGQDDQHQPRPQSTSDSVFVPTTPIPPHVSPQASQAPPPPMTTYLRTDFFTTGRRPRSTRSTNPQISRQLSGDGLQTNFTMKRQHSNPVAVFMKDNALGNNESSNSLFAPTDYDDVELTAMPFISSTDGLEIEQPDPTKGFRDNRSNLKLSTRYMTTGVVVGIALGIVLAYVNVSDIAAEWISLPGDLFLRAVNALVVPYVFCSVAVAVGEIVFVGKASIVGLQTVKVFATGCMVSTVLGMSLAFVFRPLFRFKNTSVSPATNAVGLTCSNAHMLEMLTNNSITCSSNASERSLDHAFVLDDVHKMFEMNSDAAINDLTFDKHLIMTLESVVSNDIFASFADGDLLAIITFSMVLGSIAGRSYFSNDHRVSYVYLLLLQLSNTFFLAMEWLVWTMPIGVISIIAGVVASNQVAVIEFPKVFVFLVACISATVLHILFVYPFMTFVLARCNPYAHMHHMIRSYVFAFGSSSSLATIPVTLSCVQMAGVWSHSIATFVVSVGVVTNMSGSGWYYPIGIIFLAESSGNGDALTLLRLVSIFLLTIVACVTTPAVPNGGMVVMLIMYKTVFGGSPLPSTWALYVACNSFADRLLTICNVNDNIMALKVIADPTDKTLTGNYLDQRN